MNPLPDSVIQRLQKIFSEPDLSGTKYRLIRKIGFGGMAEVYLVFDEKLERQAAMKVLCPASIAEDFSERMMREAKFIAQLEHPSIVPVHDMGLLPDGRNYYVMKYVQGESLDSYAAHISLSERLAIFRKICDAVSFAHSHGVIHRDLKPKNIMVGPFGEVQVMDWGLAKLLNDHPIEVPSFPRIRAPFETDGGTVLGTPGYMAPEQERGDTTVLDERTDIYALGAILKELTGSSAPKRLKAVGLKATSKNPADRYPSARELSDDISAYLNGMPMVAYKENLLEKAARWSARNSFVLWLIVAYLIMRSILYFLL